MILLGCKSERVVFDPDAYKANSSRESLINEDEIEVLCSEPKFDEFACMHKDKWTELRILLQQARIPKEIKSKLLKQLDKFIK